MASSARGAATAAVVCSARELVR
uniref:Uncharacterized protein n=1 Tax=Arundo donax TaxID=35708 RepID=A0A0A9END8_ARUDO